MGPYHGNKMHRSLASFSPQLLAEAKQKSAVRTVLYAFQNETESVQMKLREESRQDEKVSDENDPKSDSHGDVPKTVYSTQLKPLKKKGEEQPSSDDSSIKTSREKAPLEPEKEESTFSCFLDFNLCGAKYSEDEPELSPKSTKCSQKKIIEEDEHETIITPIIPFANPSENLEIHLHTEGAATNFDPDKMTITQEPTIDNEEDPVGGDGDQSVVSMDSSISSHGDALPGTSRRRRSPTKRTKPIAARDVAAERAPVTVERLEI